jgi:hypothetical protein
MKNQSISGVFQCSDRFQFPDTADTLKNPTTLYPKIILPIAILILFFDFIL